VAGPRALEEASSSRGIDDGEEGTLLPEKEGKMTGDRRGDAANAGLHEDVRREIPKIA